MLNYNKLLRMELFKLKVTKNSAIPCGRYCECKYSEYCDRSCGPYNDSSPFKLIELTDEYSKVYEKLSWDVYLDKFKTIFNYNKSFQKIFGKSLFHAAEFLEKIPIYLVDTGISNTNRWDGEKCIHIPSDKRRVSSGLEEFDIDKWLKSKEGEQPSAEDNSHPGITFSERELLAIYINDGSPRIFIWVDKIKDYQWPKNSEALFAFILFHELAHAMMDVTLYGVPSAKDFTERDLPYVFIEESFADALALEMVFDTRCKLEQDYIKEFIENQGTKYSEAVIRLWERNCLDLVSQWMAMKVLFDYDLAHLIRDFWKEKDFKKLTCFESVGHPQWFARKTSLNKWRLTDATSLMPVRGFKEYDSFWSFDENMLCRVRDDSNGYHYGCVNESGAEQIPVEYDHIYSFENGMTIAKKEGNYGAIDLHNNTVIPFNLPYEDVRAFRNGRAAVKNSCGLWGVIDTKGVEIVPCENEKIVL